MTESEAKTKWPITGLKHGHSKGYERVLCSNHPNADSSGYVYLHQYIASVVLGRGLLAGETVHHIDGDPKNNANANLLICSHAYHRQLHERLARSENWPQFSTVRESHRPRCLFDGCDNSVPYHSATGLCVKHYWKNLKDNPAPCSVVGCSAPAGMRSGLCRKHLQQIHNARRSRHG